MMIQMMSTRIVSGTVAQCDGLDTREIARAQVINRERKTDAWASSHVASVYDSKCTKNETGLEGRREESTIDSEHMEKKRNKARAKRERH
jgi:hypothetical protein